ncbi:MAG TPA: hypothetical protein PLR06_11100 [Cyclobacteriaceae bacterium]|nr:hypothetical protein [Cyclobacteriaceae bacterium]
MILFSPLLLDDKWIAPESVWKRYFEQVAPQVRLIQAGMQGDKSKANYLHLYAWPDNLQTFLETAKTVNEWVPCQTGGIDLSDLIRLFFDGHGTDGFVEWKNKVERVISGSIHKLGEGQPVEKVQRDLDDSEKKFRVASMRGRWQHYRKLFTLMPNENGLKEIDDLINSIALEVLILAPKESFQEQTTRYHLILRQIDDLLMPIRKLIQKRTN